MNSTAGQRMLQLALFEECEVTGWDPQKQNTFSEEIAFLHAELSEAFEQWRLKKNCDGYYKCTDCGCESISAPRTLTCFERIGNADGSYNCYGTMKPEGVPYEFADVIIGLCYNAELYDFDLFGAVDEKHRYNLTRSYEKEGRRLHD